MPGGQKNEKIKQKQYCNKSNTDFKNGPHPKKKKIKNKQTNKTALSPKELSAKSFVIKF